MKLSDEEKRKLFTIMMLMSQGRSGQQILAALQPVLAIYEQKKQKEENDKAAKNQRNSAIGAQLGTTAGTLGGAYILTRANAPATAPTTTPTNTTPQVSTTSTAPVTPTGGSSSSIATPSSQAEWNAAGTAASGEAPISSANTPSAEQQLPAEILNDPGFMSTINWQRVGQGAVSIGQIIQAYNQYKNGDKVGAGITATGGGINAAAALGSETAGEIVPYVGPALETYSGVKSQFDKNQTDEDRSYNAFMTVPRAIASYYTGGLSSLAEAYARKQWGGTMKKLDKFNQTNPMSPVFLHMQASKLWTSDKWKTEGKRLKKLIDAGIVIPDQYLTPMQQTRGMSKQELIARANATGGNSKFEESRNEADLRPQDIIGKAALIEHFGSDWFGKFTDAQRLAIADQLLKAGAVNEHHGTYDVDWSKVPNLPTGGSTPQTVLKNGAPTGTASSLPAQQPPQTQSAQFMAPPKVQPNTQPVPQPAPSNGMQPANPNQVNSAVTGNRPQQPQPANPYAVNNAVVGNQNGRGMLGLPQGYDANSLLQSLNPNMDNGGKKMGLWDLVNAYKAMNQTKASV